MFDLTRGVVDDGVKQYVANVRRENFQYFLAGPRGQTMYESALGNKTGKAVDVASGMLIHEAKHFDLPDLEEPANLLSRPRQIGEYNVMYPHMTPDSTYNSDWRAILVYDEKRDGFRRISLCDAINNCARWNHFGEIHFPDGFESTKDIFMKSDRNPVRLFGDMDLKGLPRKARDDWVASVINKLHDETANDVEALISLCKQLDPTDISSVTKHLEIANGTGKNQKLPAPNETKVPFGYGNAAGIDELSHEYYANVDEYKEYHKLAKKAMRAFRTIKKVTDSLTDDDHKLTDDEIVCSLTGEKLYPIIRMAGEPTESANLMMAKFVTSDLTTDYAIQVINATGFGFNDFLNFAFAPTYDGDHSAALKAPGQIKDGDLQKDAFMIGSDGTKLPEDDEIFEVFKDGCQFFKNLVQSKQLDNLKKETLDKIGQVIFALSLNIDSVDFYNLVSRLDETNLIAFLKKVTTDIQKGGKDVKENLFNDFIENADDQDLTKQNAKFSGLSSTKKFTYANAAGDVTTHDDAFTAALQNMAFSGGEYTLQGQRVTGVSSNLGGSGKRRAIIDGKGVLTIQRGDGRDDDGDAYAKGKSKPVERFFHELLLKLPVTQQTLCMFAESDLVVPFNFILFRPRMTYRMSSGVCLKTGASTGEVTNFEGRGQGPSTNFLFFVNFNFLGKSLQKVTKTFCSSLEQ